MPRRKKTTRSLEEFTTRQLKRKKPINLDSLKEIEPLNDKQEEIFKSFDNDRHIVACGVAGTGKTFALLFNALYDVLSDKTPYEKVYIVRSLVPTREIGFLPGSHEDKSDLYQIPYKNMVKSFFDYTEEEMEMVYGNLKTQGTLSFWSTSFIRGTTLENCVVLVDEFQNANFHELCSIITRVGPNCKIIFSGDASQSDLIKTNERNGIIDFMRILRSMPSFDIIEFGLNDIVRSGLVKEFLVAKHNLGL